MTHTELAVLGRTLRGRVDAPTTRHLRTQWIEALAPVAAPAEPFVVELRTGSAPPPDGPTVPGAHGLAYRPIGPDTFWVLDPDAAAGAVLVDVSEEPARLELVGAPFVAFRALDAAFTEVLAATGTVRLHAAVVTRGRTTVALLGPSGRGKSTTALRAMLAGWQIVTEDDCFVDTASLAVHGAGSEVRLRAEALDGLRPALGEVAAGPPTGDRHPVPFTAVGGRVDTAVLTHFAHLSRARGPLPAWRPMARAERVMALHESCGIPLTARVRRVHANWFPAVSSRNRWFRLDPGPITSAFPELPEHD